ncbi:SET and MYND domain-containing protein 4-like [Sitodiplosis mosellana]|uniref:SET and MYND domain-containing protein 4-like n=1 Tax=Sitodiplosis mosellana TaxID=263140 RepID=UPI0024448C86|nr:SET and MYND domain-containing protein 4-like [Sitodiplosis mosellana]
MLWEKESNGSYSPILGKGDKHLHASMKDLNFGPNQNKNQSSRVKQKSNARAKKFRFDGNEKVKTEDWHEAMYLYNKCLCNAEPYSENISLAYANRALCFLKLNMYKKCLIDINSAIQANYPDRLMSKLMTRRAFCLNKIKEEEQIESKEVKLDFPEDKLFPGMANVLKIECNPEFGRHVVATCDIDVGKVVLAEEAFVSTAVMSADKMLCSKCFKGEMNFVACNHCNISMFCNEDCYQRDYFHETCCGKAIDKVDHFTTFVVRTLVFALDTFRTIDALTKFVESVIIDEEKDAPSLMADDVSKYRAFLQCGIWLSDEEKKKLHDTSNQVYSELMSIEEIKEKVHSNEEERFLQHLLLYHLYIVKCNSFQNKMTGGMFLIQKLFNHSCAPNLLQYFDANKTICFASRKIKKGEQLFVTYGMADFWSQPAYLRQDILYSVYGFRCKCIKCSSQWPISSEYIKADPEYIDLGYEMKHYEFDDAEVCDILKEKCLALLRRYDEITWNIELDDICNFFVKLLNQPYKESSKESSKESGKESGKN